MSVTLQWLIVAPLVVVAATSAVWRMLTTRLRIRVLSGLLALLPQSNGRPWVQLRAALMRKVSLETAGGCAACSKR